MTAQAYDPDAVIRKIDWAKVKAGMQLAEFDETKHPRDQRGRFATTPDQAARDVMLRGTFNRPSRPMSEAELKSASDEYMAGIMARQGVGGADPAVVGRMQDGVGAALADPRMEALVGKYGMPPLVAGASPPGDMFNPSEADANVVGKFDKALGYIALYSAPGKDFAADNGADVQPGQGAISNQNGWRSTFTHEYGHYVADKLGANAEWWTPENVDSRLMAFHDAYYPANRGFQDAMDAATTPAQRTAAIGDTISLYAHSNWQEGFAEAFAATLSPGYDRSKFGPTDQRLLELAEGITR